jgi:DNA-binding PadR family transcriptional regulator
VAALTLPTCASLVLGGISSVMPFGDILFSALHHQPTQEKSMTKAERELLLLVAEMVYEPYLDLVCADCYREEKSPEQASRKFYEITNPVKERLKRLTNIILAEKQPKRKAKPRRGRRLSR